MTISVAPLLDMLRNCQRLVVLTGAGCSTESGIPDYRDANGDWKSKQPIQYQEFVRKPEARQRYWARSMIGWPVMSDAQPNAAHHALASLEAAGWIHTLITQNVDGLHQQAGSRNVVDLHGRLDTVSCVDCGHQADRDDFQIRLQDANPEWRHETADIAPDGDALLDGVKFGGFVVPACPACGGVMKPDVVFFGEAVPRDRVQFALQAVDDADGLMVVGSSLMVFSGYRFARAAASRGVPVGVVNMGRTRADDQIDFKIQASCGAALQTALQALGIDPLVPHLAG